MAYNTRFRFRFESNVNGNNYRIDISQNGYSGSVLERAVGGSPVLRRDQNEHIGGTSLEFPAECLVNEEFAALYTTNPHEFKADLYCNNIRIWQGYVTTELYAEPDIAPPYDVTVTCTDGLGELKNVPFTGGNTSSLEATIAGILTNTGLSLSISKVSSISAVRAQLDFLSSAIYDSRHLTGKTCYEVLQTILRSLNMVITQYDGAWLLYRESDIAASSLRTVEMGSLASAPWWVVGQLSSEVRPARKRVAVSSPAHYRDNALPGIDTYTPSGTASWSSAGYWVLSKNASIVGRLAMDGAKFRQLLTVKARAASGSVEQKVRIQVKLTTSSTSYAPSSTFFLTESSTTETNRRRDMGHAVIQSSGFSWNASAAYIERTLAAPSESPDADVSLLELTLPFAEGSRSNYPGTVEITISAPSGNTSTIAVHDAILTKEVELAGVRHVLNIDNGARGEADEVELDFIPEVTDIASGGLYSETGYRSTEALMFMNGSLRDSAGNLLINFRTAQLGSQPYISLMAKDYALDVALPRLVKSGVVNTPLNAGPFLPVRATSGGMEFVFDTWSWDLYNDELSFEMTSLPAASITAESEEVQVAVPTAPSGSSTHGGSTGGGGGAGGSITAADVINALGYTPANPSDLHTEGWDDAASKAHEHSNMQALAWVTVANVGRWNAAADDMHEHDNKPILDGISNASINNWNEAAKAKHTHSNKGILDTITQALINAWNNAVSMAHSHSNKALLDTFSQSDVDGWDDAAEKAHTHSNKGILDGITAAKVQKWDSNTPSSVYICYFNSTPYSDVDSNYRDHTVFCDFNGTAMPLTDIDSDDNFIFKGFEGDRLLELTLSSSGWSSREVSIDVDSGIYKAIYGTTRHHDVGDAVSAGKIVLCSGLLGLNMAYAGNKQSATDDVYEFVGFYQGKKVTASVNRLDNWSYVLESETDVFNATYNVTHQREVESAVSAGNIVICSGLLGITMTYAGHDQSAGSATDDAIEFVGFYLGKKVTARVDRVDNWSYEMDSSESQFFICDFGETTYAEAIAALNAGKILLAHDGGTDAKLLADLTIRGGRDVFVFSGLNASGQALNLLLWQDNSWATERGAGANSFLAYFDDTTYSEVLSQINAGHDVVVRDDWGNGQYIVFHLAESDPANDIIYFFRIDREGRRELCTVNADNVWTSWLVN